MLRRPIAVYYDCTYNCLSSQLNILETLQTSPRCKGDAASTRTVIVSFVEYLGRYVHIWVHVQVHNPGDL